jgi:hypothetical protein
MRSKAELARMLDTVDNGFWGAMCCSSSFFFLAKYCLPGVSQRGFDIRLLHFLFLSLSCTASNIIHYTVGCNEPSDTQCLLHGGIRGIEYPHGAHTSQLDADKFETTNISISSDQTPVGGTW